MVNAAMRSRIGDSSMSCECRSPGGRWIASMIGCAAPPCSTIPPRKYGSPASRAAAIAAASGTIGSSIRWVTERPRCECSRNGKMPSTNVWKWYMR